MAITNYSELKAAVKKWSHREDLDLLIDDFIALAESEMLNNPVSPLRVRGEESLETGTTSTASRFLTLPARYKEMRRVQIVVNGSRYDLRFRAPEQLRIRDESGVPSFFTITSQLEFDVTPDAAYTVEMQCLVDLPALTSSNTENAVLTASPSVYLFGCLWAAMKYGNDLEAAQGHYQSFMSALQGLNNKYSAGRYGPAPVMRIEGSTP